VIIYRRRVHGKPPRDELKIELSGMAETVAEQAPTPAEISACAWLPDDELRIYSEEFARTSFQGGLQWYRNATDPHAVARLYLFELQH
jgi:hypothetical protein